MPNDGATPPTRPAPPQGLPPIERLTAIMARLRAPDGCPWDREQTHQSLRRYLEEEAAELIDAIDQSDDDAMRDELGDVLLQVVFHAQLAAERDAFTLDDVATAIADKLVRRHPHVFSDATAAHAGDVEAIWQAVKDTERAQPRGPLDGVPASLSPLTRAHEVTRKAARTGFDWPNLDGVLAKLDEETAELREAIATDDPNRIEDELGDLLFVLVNLARKLDLRAADALRRATTKFETRFLRSLEILAQDGVDPTTATLERIDVAWDQAKAEQRGQ